MLKLPTFLSAIALLSLLVLLFAPSCAPASAAAQGGIGGAPGGWDDLRGRADDFQVAPIEPGVALLIDARTGQAWILAGNPHSWQAVEPIGGL